MTRRRRQAIVPSGPYVRVVLPVGEYTAPDCTVDQFAAGVLAVTSLADDSVLRVFPAGDWLHGTAYDATGHPGVSFEASRP